jgi:hypothetical protein
VVAAVRVNARCVSAVEELVSIQAATELEDGLASYMN